MDIIRLWGKSFIWDLSQERRTAFISATVFKHLSFAKLVVAMASEEKLSSQFAIIPFSPSLAVEL